MIVSWFILWWIWENIPHWLLALIPLAMLVADIADFSRRWFPQRDDYQAQITKASHGAAFVILSPMVTSFILHNPLIWYSPVEWRPWMWPFTYAIMALGVWRLIIGWSRTSRQRRDMNLIVRAIVKLALGAALFFALTHNLLPQAAWPQPYRAYANVAAFWLSVWLVVAAITRLLLLMKKMRGPNDLHAAPQARRLGAGWHWE
jgi:hypothetical protein